MKKLLLLTFAVLACTSLQAKQVDVTTAQLVAQQVLQQNSYARHLSSKPAAARLKLVYTATAQRANLATSLATAVEGNLFYVFNHEDGGGFVIVSADDAVSPILAYSNESSFRADSIPCNVQAVLDDYSQAIASAIAAGSDATQTWSTASTETTSEATHLVRSQWHQHYPYNFQTPMLGGEHCVTGCVATAMAQIMYYWKYPDHGTGSHEYYWEGGNKTLSANFEETFDWANMRDTYASDETFTQESVNAVSHLMRQCGVSVDMSYYSESGSGSGIMKSALYTYFGYSQTSMRSYDLSDMDNTEWIKILKSEIDNNRPVFYSSGDHAFICDGYDANDYLHINFGWGGYSDGFYKHMGTNKYMKNSYQEIVCGIMPSHMAPTVVDDGVEITDFRCSNTNTTVASGAGKMIFHIYFDYPTYTKLEDVALVTVDGDNNILEHVGKVYSSSISGGGGYNRVSYSLTNLCNEGSSNKVVTFMPAYKVGGVWKVATDATPIVKTVKPFTSSSASWVSVNFYSNCEQVIKGTNNQCVLFYPSDGDFKGTASVSISNEAGITVHSEACDVTAAQEEWVALPIDYTFDEPGTYTFTVTVANEPGSVLRTAELSLSVYDVVRLQSFDFDTDYYGEQEDERYFCFIPAEPIQLVARFQNPTNETVTKEYALLTSNGIEKTSESVTIPAGGEATVNFRYTAEIDEGGHFIVLKEKSASSYVSVEQYETTGLSADTKFYRTQTPQMVLLKTPKSYSYIDSDTLTLCTNQADWLKFSLKEAYAGLEYLGHMKLIAQLYNGSKKIAEYKGNIGSIDEDELLWPIDGFDVPSGLYTIKFYVSQSGLLFDVKDADNNVAVYPVIMKEPDLLPQQSRILNDMSDFRFSANTANLRCGETTQLRFALSNPHSETFRGTIKVKENGNYSSSIISEEKSITIAGNNTENVYGTISVTVPAYYPFKTVDYYLYAKSQYDEEYRRIIGAYYYATIDNVNSVEHVLADSGVTVADGKLMVTGHIKSVSVHDVSGRCVEGYDVTDNVVNLQALPKGTYVVVLDAEGTDPIRLKVVR